MEWQDLVNGLFELVAGLLLFKNVAQLHKDKKVMGVHILPTLVFMVWGYWNLYFYPYLACSLSFAGGVLVVVANTIWVAQMIYYRKNKEVAQL